jgi:hypothetical protein
LQDHLFFHARFLVCGYFFSISFANLDESRYFTVCRCSQ